MTDKKLRATITGVGMYVPDKVLDNKYFESIVETNDEWITSRTGIKERRVLENGATSDLAARAVDDLLKSKNMSAEEIDLIIVSTITPDMFFPSTACVVQRKVGAKNAWGFDLSAACSGFVFGLETAASFIESGKYKKVVLVGADKMSAITDYTDRNTCILFGDAASAVLLEPTEDLSYGLQDSVLYCDGTGEDALHMLGGGSRNPATHETVDEKMHYIYQDGRAVFKVAVVGMADAAVEILERNNLKREDISFLAPHQANMRIINATRDRLGLQNDQVMVNIHKYGNTTAATIPLVVTEYYRAGKVKKGDKLVFAAFGGGYTWGAQYIVWSID
ncbi:MAG: beta-ketoacyl-ACP synthase III [Ignavibacteriales bacterium]|nr:beta-ketoacyl-ACP synthase III [Ignavibacteriales bacterium]